MMLISGIFAVIAGALILFGLLAWLLYALQSLRTTA